MLIIDDSDGTECIYHIHSSPENVAHLHLHVCFSS